MPHPAVPTSFQNSAATIIHTFSDVEYEFEEEQEVRAPVFAAAGANGAFDGLRSGLAPVELKRIRMRAVNQATSPATLDTAVDAMRAAFRRIGRGKLWMTMADGSLRWTWARAQVVPFRRFQIPDFHTQEYRVEWLADPDWYDDTVTTVIEAVTADAETWVVANPGNIDARLMTIRLRSSSAAGFTNPIITNQTTGDVLATLRDAASANDEVRYDTERGAVEYSTNDGGAYADDFAQYVLPTIQVPVSFRLAPGANTLRYNGGGTPNLSVETAFYAPYA